MYQCKAIKAISSFCLNDNAAVIMSHIAVMFLLSFASTLTRTHCLTHFDSDRSKKIKKIQYHSFSLKFDDFS